MTSNSARETARYVPGAVVADDGGEHAKAEQQGEHSSPAALSADGTIVNNSSSASNSSSNNSIPTDSAWFAIHQDGPKGRGLVAIRDIPPRTILHVAPCIWVSAEDYSNHMQYTILEHYLFNGRGKVAGSKLLALGYGSLFNHATHPNVDYRVDAERCCILYQTGYQAVAKGEELCISYGASLWFPNADDEQNNDRNSDEQSSLSTDDGNPEDFLAKLSLLLGE
jgi:SET domain-containing protein